MEKRTNKMGIDNQKTSFEHQSLEVSMLDKDNFSDEELDSYLCLKLLSAYGKDEEFLRDIYNQVKENTNGN